MAWRYFTINEFQCKCGCLGNQIDFRLVDILDQARSELGFPIVISSGYRCPAHNDRVSKTGHNGPHTTGKAVDVAVMGIEAYRLLEWALRHGRITGIGVGQRGPHSKRILHFDTLGPADAFRPTIWSY